MISTSTGLAAVICIAVLASCVAVEWRRPESRNELEALQQVRRIVRAEQRFHQERGRYALLEELDGHDPYTAPGYRIDVEVYGPRYEVHARPLAWPETGRRSFYADNLGEIRETWGDRPAVTGTATAPSR